MTYSVDSIHWPEFFGPRNVFAYGSYDRRLRKFKTLFKRTADPNRVRPTETNANIFYLFGDVSNGFH